jgi:uncharacterized pyridoxal phosphate-containing UPF0001 family protein
VAAALNRRLQDLGRSLDVFHQVNSSAEPQKFGLAPEDVEQFVAICSRSAHCGSRADDTCGALCRRAGGPRLLRANARSAAAQDGNAPGTFDELSMGMSGDFELAIEYGATTVRIGPSDLRRTEPDPLVRLP